MAKWFGKIGYATTNESSPGVWTEQIVEQECFGDFNSFGRRLSNSGNVNDNVEITNEISIVLDPYLSEHFADIRYATYGGAKWKIASIDIQYPRMILRLGGAYNVH